MRLLTAILLSTVFSIQQEFAQVAQPGNIATRHEIMNRVVEMLRWKTYWEGSQSLLDYRVGKSVNTKIVRSSNEIAVFMASVGANFQFRFDGSGHMAGSFGSFVVGQTNEQAAASYLGQECGGFRLKPGVSPHLPSGTDGVLPLERVCLGQKSEQHFTEENFQFNLPGLSQPDYVASRSEPADAPRFRKVVEAAVREQLRYQKTCKSAMVTIPYYSTTDPSVFVYVDLGLTCAESSGMFDFRRTPDGSWEPPGKLWSVRPPNDWSWTIQQIKRTALVTYEIR